MTRRDVLKNIHEPFGDAFYFGPESLSERYTDDPEAREGSGSATKTYKDVLDTFADNEGKRVFIKDMAYYLFSPDSKPTGVASSLGGTEPSNPTRLPESVLERFHFTFLIRHPRRSIPSYYRCTIPPLDDITGFYNFMPNEAGYEELVRLFNYLLETGIVDKRQLTVVDADDMLDKPEPVIRQFCDKVGLDFRPEMLVWTEDDKDHAAGLFAKWNGFHDDAIGTSGLEARTHAQKTSTVEKENKEWEDKYGAEAQKVIRATVDANIPHYEYLKQFCLEV